MGRIDTSIKWQCDSCDKVAVVNNDRPPIGWDDCVLYVSHSYGSVGKHYYLCEACQGAMGNVLLPEEEHEKSLRQTFKNLFKKHKR
jgi:hypothetical protein